ncbi:MAG: UvrB/UvrC motif-containing protein [Christensenellales bacterium]
MEISRSTEEQKRRRKPDPQQKTMKLQLLEQEMKQAAAMDFERAALLRDEMIALKQGKPVEKSKGKKTGYKGRKKRK